MDIAASIAGLVSLGIQVTQSLVDYYTAYTGREADVAHTTKKLNRLAGMLESLRCHLVDRKFLPDEQDLLKTIESAIQDCEECIRELQSLCDKVKDNSTAGIRATARASTRRLAYPFRKGTLQTIDDSVDEIVSHLSLALQVLQQGDICKFQNDIDDTKTLLDLIRADQISSDVRNWLKAPDVTVNYDEACKKKHGGTGLWLVKSSAFSAWLVKPNSFLWLKGFAGCGKSVLCSTVIQYTFRYRRSNPRIGIAFFFFTFSDNGKQDTSAMLRALVLQLSGQLNDSHGLLSRLHYNRPNGIPADEVLIGCLRQLVRAFDDVYIILDALEESPRNKHREDLLQALVDLRAWSEPSLHLLVTSREEPDIRDILLNELGALQDETISLKNDSIDRDIASFISGSLQNDRRLQKWGKYHDQIKQVLTERAQGVFRWVECQFLALASCHKSKHQLDKLLASLPQSLDKSYERILSNINEQSKEEARRILTLLCCAKRPLAVSEVIEGIAVKLGENPHFNVDARLDDEDEIYHICPGLIEVDYYPGGKESTVRIAHFSVQEYLESERIHQHSVAIFGVRKPEAHAEIACICLTYLLGLVSPMPGSEYPLALYAAKHWYEHYHDGDQGLYQVQHQAVRLFQSARGEFENWVRIWDVDEYDEDDSNDDESDDDGYDYYEYNYYGYNNYEYDDRISDKHAQSPVYYASLLGLNSLVFELLCENPSACLVSEQISDLVNAQGGHYGNALQAASAGGHEKIVLLLLDRGADIHAQGGKYGNALQAASAGGHEKIVLLLLDRGADIHAQGGKYGNALQAASAGGHEKIVLLLLDRGADIHAQGGKYGNALQAASAGGHEKIVLLLLDRGADIHAQGGKYGNALQAASTGGDCYEVVSTEDYIEIVRLLVDKGADANAQSSEYGNALKITAEGGHEKRVQPLLDKGADVNAEGGRYGSALQAASAGGHKNIVQLLLEKGADMNAEGGRYGSALRAATNEGYMKIAQVLVDRFAVIYTQCDHYANALQAASTGGGHHKVVSIEDYIKIVQLLLNKGADVNAQGGYYGNALQAASAGGHKKIVQLLLDNVSDINAQGGLYGNALQATTG